MTRKVLDLRLDGLHIVCIMRNPISEPNPFRVYKVASGYRRQIAKYGDILSVICFLKDLYMDGADTFSMVQIVEWAKSRGSIF